MKIDTTPEKREPARTQAEFTKKELVCILWAEAKKSGKFPDMGNARVIITPEMLDPEKTAVTLVVTHPLEKTDDKCT